MFDWEECEASSPYRSPLELVDALLNELRFTPDQRSNDKLRCMLQWGVEEAELMRAARDPAARLWDRERTLRVLMAAGRARDRHEVVPDRSIGPSTRSFCKRRSRSLRRLQATE